MATTHTPQQHAAVTAPAFDRPGRARRIRLTPRGICLIVLTVGGTLLEGLLVVGTGARGAIAMAPQATAVAPFGVFHDLRWLLVFSRSWPLFAVELLALLAFRTTITAASVWAAWPADRHAPPWRHLLRRSAVITVVSVLVLAPCASLLVALALAPVSYLWMAAVPSALLITLLLHHGVVLSWWRRHPRLRSSGWVLLSWPVLTAAGAGLVVAPTAAVAPIAIVAGLFNALAWRGVVGSLARAPARAPFAPVAPIGIALVCLGACLVTAVSVHPPHKSLTASPTAAKEPAGPTGHGQPVLMASGYGIAWDGAPTSLGKGFAVERFSYAGSVANGDPLPYKANATLRSLPATVALMRAQVQRMADRWHRPVDIVAESEGTVVLTAYLMSTPNAPVRRAVLLSPLVRPARATIPPPGVPGWGLAAGWQLRGMSTLARSVSQLDVSPDSPFVQSLAGHGDALSDAFGCPADGVDQLLVLPLADALGMPYDLSSHIPHRVVLALHGTLLSDSHTATIVREWLRTGDAPADGAANTARRLTAAAGLAWQVPDLSLATGSLPDDSRCTTARAELTVWLAPNS